MSLFSSPAEHADNPPSTWRVEKIGPGCWSVLTKAGVGITSQSTKGRAEAILTSGFYFDLWHKEQRWYAGEPVEGWKPYAGLAQPTGPRVADPEPEPAVQLEDVPVLRVPAATAITWLAATDEHPAGWSVVGLLPPSQDHVPAERAGSWLTHARISDARTAAGCAYWQIVAGDSPRLIVSDTSWAPSSPERFGRVPVLTAPEVLLVRWCFSCQETIPGDTCTTCTEAHAECCPAGDYDPDLSSPVLKCPHPTCGAAEDIVEDESAEQRNPLRPDAARKQVVVTGVGGDVRATEGYLCGVCEQPVRLPDGWDIEYVENLIHA